MHITEYQKYLINEGYIKMENVNFKYLFPILCLFCKHQYHISRYKVDEHGNKTEAYSICQECGKRVGTWNKVKFESFWSYTPSTKTDIYYKWFDIDRIVKNKIKELLVS